jgi:hypothetical protein
MPHDMDVVNNFICAVLSMASLLLLVAVWMMLVVSRWIRHWMARDADRSFWIHANGTQSYRPHQLTHCLYWNGQQWRKHSFDGGSEDVL